MPSQHTNRAAASHTIRAALLLASFVVVAAAQQAKEGSPDAARPPQPPAALTLDVTVTDAKGRYVTGLTKEQFTLTDGGAPREITSVSDAPEPASVGVLFDISGSMNDGRHSLVGVARRAFARFFFRASQLRNEYFMWAFSRTVTELTGWTGSEAELSRGIDQIAPKTMPTKGSHATALYDACDAALDKLAAGPHRKRVLLVFTDGQDNISRVSFKALRQKARESGVLIYAVGIVEQGNPGSLDAGGQAILDELASVSGGRAFFPQGNELGDIIDRIATELEHQFRISFVPANAAKRGELNRVRIKVKPPPDLKVSLYVRAREGYFTAPQ